LSNCCSVVVVVVVAAAADDDDYCWTLRLRVMQLAIDVHLEGVDLLRVRAVAWVVLVMMVAVGAVAFVTVLVEWNLL